MISLNRLREEDSARLYNGKFYIKEHASTAEAKTIMNYAAIRATNDARRHAIHQGEYTLIGPEARVIQPEDWKTAIRPDWVVEIVFDDPHLETENLKKVVGGYVDPLLKNSVQDDRPAIKRALSKLSFVS